jgi:hypothetical protein
VKERARTRETEVIRETRRADEMLAGFHVRFIADGAVYAGTIASTRPVGAHRIEFAFADAFRWTFRNGDLFHRLRPDDGADAGEDAEADRPEEFQSDDLAAVPA